MMEDDVLEKIYSRLAEQPFEYMRIIWHGGEPMTAGLAFYKKAMKLQKKYLGDRKIINGMQTNGTLIDKEWCNFFLKNDFKIGVSLDGDEYLNRDRISPDGEEAFQDIIKGIKLLKSFNVKYGLLSVVNKKIIGHEKTFYLFMKSLTNSLRLNIVVPFGMGAPQADVFNEGELDKIADSYLKIYDLWKDDSSNDNPFMISPFDELVGALVNNKIRTCYFSERGCKNFASIGCDGKVYSCGRFSEDERFYMGSIMNDSFEEIYKSSITKMKSDRSDNVEKECKDCKYRHVCNGGCAHESFSILGNFYSKTPFCRVYYKLLERIENDINKIEKIN